MGQRGLLEQVFQGMDVDDSRGVDEAEFAAFLQRKLRSPPLGHSVSHGTICCWHHWHLDHVLVFGS